MLVDDDNVQLGYTKGLRFTFRDADNVIQAMYYPFSGKETICLNNKIVSMARSYKLGTSHTFRSLNSDQYTVKFEVESLFKGKLKCSLFKNEKLIQEYKVFKTQRKQWPIYVLFICYGIVVGLTSSYFNLNFFQAALSFIPLILITLWFQKAKWVYESAS